MAGMEGHQNPAAKPLNHGEVEREAQKLENSASKFLSGGNDVEAFKAFHNDVVELQKHGLDSVKQVFQKMQDDSKGLNPLLPNVTFTDGNDAQTGEHKLELSQFPSLASKLTMNTRHLDTEVTAQDVNSYAKMGKDGPHDWIKNTPDEKVWTLGWGEIQAETKQKSGDKITPRPSDDY